MKTHRRHHKSNNGYGNIYTPHAGSMVIQVQRESGLANRTIILSQRQVAFLRFVLSRKGIVLAAVAAASWILFALQAARVPLLADEVSRLRHENQQIDTLHAALSTLHTRYDRIRLLLGAGSTATPVATAKPSAPTATSSLAPTAPTTPTSSPAAPGTTAPVPASR